MADKKYKEEIQIITRHHDKSSVTKTLWNLVRVYEGETLTEQTLYRVEGTSSQKVTNPAFVSDAQYSDFIARSKSNKVTRDYIKTLFKRGNSIVPGARILYFHQIGDNGNARYGIKKSGVIESMGPVKRIELSDKVDFEDFVLDVVGVPDRDYGPYDPMEDNHLPLPKRASSPVEKVKFTGSSQAAEVALKRMKKE